MKSSKDGECTTSLGLFHSFAVFMGKKASLVSILIWSYGPCLSSFHHAPLWRTWLCLLGASLGYWEVAVRSPQSRLFAGWTSLAPSAFHYRASAPAPSHLEGPLLNSLQFIEVFLELEGPKLGTVFKMSSNKCWAEKDNPFPRTTGNDPGKSDPPCIRWQPSILLFNAMRNCLSTFSNIEGTLRNGQIQSSVALLEFYRRALNQTVVQICQQWQSKAVRSQYPAWDTVNACSTVIWVAN